MAKVLGNRAERQLRDAVRYTGPRSLGTRRLPRVPRDAAELNVIPVRNTYGSTIERGSFVMYDPTYSTIGDICVTRPFVQLLYPVYVLLSDLGAGASGLARVRGRCRVRLDDSEIALLHTASGSAPSNKHNGIWWVGPRRNSFTAWVNGPCRVLNPFVVLSDTDGDGSADQRVYVDDDGMVEVYLGDLQSQATFWGRIRNSGPNSEADYANHRYWVEPYLYGSVGSNRKVTAVNLWEQQKYGNSSKSHLLPVDASELVLVTVAVDPSNVAEYTFTRPLPPIFIVTIATASGSTWNTASYTGTAYNTVAKTVAVTAVPSAAVSSYPVLTVGQTCLCTYNSASDRFDFIGSGNAIPAPSSFYTAGSGGGNKIAVYST